MMKKVFIVSLLLFNACIYVIGQEKYSLSFLTGYCTDFELSNHEPGFAIQGAFKYNVSRNLWLGVHLSQSSIRQHYVDLTLFRENSSINRTYQAVTFDVANEFLIQSKHIIEPSLGVYVQHSHASIPSYTIHQVDNTYSDFRMKSEDMYDVGLSAGVSYKYKIRPNLLLGITTATNFSISNGWVFNTYSILPCIEVKF